jgi:phosphoribosylaminoimidazole-succinocarboxamide synthase
MATIPGLELEYEGSVKNVFGSQSEPQSLWFQFTDAYSVFDWGKMPDQITNKGKALTLMGAYIFAELAKASFWAELPASPHLKKFKAPFLAERWQHPSFSGNQGLAKKGLPSHFLGLVDNKQSKLMTGADQLAKYSQESTLLKVMRAEVNRPQAKSFLDQNIYIYDPEKLAAPVRRLIPLEVVFRFGMGKGSSLTKRLLDNPDYLKQLGFAQSPIADQWFDHPVIEFFSKLEAKDRFVSWQEASLLSGLSEGLFEELLETSLSVALGLHHLFAERDLELWDGKFEFVLDPVHNLASGNQQGRLLLADSVGPDEIRLIYRGQQMSKELIRQYYRGTTWAKALERSQKLASEKPGRHWKDICLQELKEAPAPLPPPVKREVDKLYGVLANHLIGRTIFRGEPSLDELVTSLDACLLTESRKN